MPVRTRRTEGSFVFNRSTKGLGRMVGLRTSTDGTDASFCFQGWLEQDCYAMNKFAPNYSLCDSSFRDGAQFCIILFRIKVSQESASHRLHSYKLSHMLGDSEFLLEAEIITMFEI
ncbi:13974_t:CDS:2 [Acaulospora morrowiae]|uniref:13974_t:CDS:1 n=1 Tax=Acaulospora morrowiae TaxID=94023 RepID=A0A9N9BP37_9GLOM|nr:13974_t:CDS:2 [Acaulospora morrowiae]